MMREKIPIIIILLGSMAISASLAFFLAGFPKDKRTGRKIILQEEKTSNPQVRSPSLLPSFTEETVLISNLRVKNFYKKKDVKIGKQNEVEFVKENDFKITFYPNDQSFLIVILSSQFEEAKKRAEDRLVKELEINPKQACLLNIVITTPSVINPEFAGINHSFTNCK